MTSQSTDYTQRKEDEAFALPPVPDSDSFLGRCQNREFLPVLSENKWYWEDGYSERQMESYGHACAEHVRAPLVEENATLRRRLVDLQVKTAELTIEQGVSHRKSKQLLARIAELEATVAADAKRYAENLHEIGEGYQQEYVTHIAERDRLRAEVEAKDAANAALVAFYGALQADAERYRWLRRGEYPFDFARSVLNDAPSGIDAAIDAARKRSEGDRLGETNPARQERNLEEEDAVANALRSSMGLPPIDFGSIRADNAARKGEGSEG